MPLKNHSSSTLIVALKQYISSSVKCPRAILSDNEASLTSAEFKEFCEFSDIERVYSAPYQAHCNGFSEKNCGLVTQQLRFFADSNTEWDTLIQQVVVNHNFSVNSATGMTPSSYILEQAHTIDADNVLPSEVESKWKMGNPNFCPYEVGHRVLNKIKYVGNRSVDKLKARFEGIFKVTKVNGSGLTYDLRHISDPNYIKLNIHYSDLKTYHFPVKELRDNRLFIEHYMRWRNIAFGEDDESATQYQMVEQDDYYTTEVPGFPGLVTTHPGMTPSQIQEGSSEPIDNDGDLVSDAGSDGSSTDLRLWEIEEAERKHHKDQAYLEYEKSWEKWQNKFSKQLTSIRKVPYDLFRVNYKAQILDFNRTFRNDPGYIMPYPDGTMPDLGPSDRGVPLALNTLECCEKNILPAQFDFNLLADLYKTERRDKIREAYALTINYVLRYFIDNEVVRYHYVDALKGAHLHEPKTSIPVSTPSPAPHMPSTPRTHKSLLGQVSPLQYHVDPDRDIISGENTCNNGLDFSAVLQENTNFKHHINKLEFQVEKLTEKLEDLQLKLVSKENHNNSFSSTLNSTLNQNSLNSISDGNVSITWGKETTVDEMINVLEKEVTRVKEYEHEKRAILEQSKLNIEQGLQPIAPPNYVEYIESVQAGNKRNNFNFGSTNHLADLEVDSRITDWSMQQTFVNETATRTLLDATNNRTSLTAHVNLDDIRRNRPKPSFHSTFNETILENSPNSTSTLDSTNKNLGNIQRNPYFLQSLDVADPDKTLIPTPSCRINPDLVNLSTDSVYGLEMAAPVKDAHKLVDISKATLEGTIHDRPRVRFEGLSPDPAVAAARDLRPRCPLCRRTGKGEKGCICTTENIKAWKERHYKD